MPRSYLIIGLKKIHVERMEEQKSGTVIIYGKYRGRKQCGCCKGFKVHSRGWVNRRLKHARMGNRLIEVRLKLRKLYCLICHKTARQQIENILPRKRSTESFRQEVFEQHVAGVTQVHLSKTHKVSGSTIERWLWDFLQYRVKELSGRSCPTVLGIDEHFFTRKKGYATSFVDLKNHKVFDVVLGRSEASLERYLTSLPGRSKVQVVVMDLSETYRALVKKYFPNAMIVADRFHAVRIVQQHFQKLWATIDPVGRKDRGLLSLFRQNRGKMSEKSLLNLEKYFLKFPSLKIFDQIQQRLLGFMRIKHVKRRKAKELIPKFLALISDLKECGIEQLQSLAKTMQSWIEPLVRMWRFTKTNGITEGFHCKMEMITRRAFGFRNFQNYRLRVLALCGWDGLFRRIVL